MKTRTMSIRGAIVLFVLFLLIFVVALIISSKKLLWKEGVNIVSSSEAIPAFPSSLSGYRVVEHNKDYYGNSFEWNGWIRVFASNDWEGIYEFPHTMNGCSHGVYMIRWRTFSPDCQIDTKVTYPHPQSVIKRGSFGYIMGSNCDEPLFKFATSNSSYIDIFYEISFWNAAP